MAAADLLGTALPESLGGNGGGFMELGILLAEVGRSVAPVTMRSYHDFNILIERH